ncbi:unnamed protein product [Penicillium salamii]|uniref:Uncharacterized protein n=1 Tax=Penicillium salamii TaxID=1612424 RepID=A0A9W4IAT3_9EURO|nr:unnamed protein product [Penicillium salamii]CAG8268168.1 unnamed protein product [Penicillium salamii]CAG8269621.1 unnamed protein product [Penicillium salamii]CAG8570982.1 unnamed protein product [Penicillium salamii]
MTEHPRPRLFCTHCHATGHTVHNCWRVEHQAALIRQLTGPPSSMKGQPRHWGPKGRGAKRRRQDRRAALTPGGGDPSHHNVPAATRGEIAPAQVELTTAPPPSRPSGEADPPRPSSRPSGEAVPPSPTRTLQAPSEATPPSLSIATRAGRWELLGRQF